MWIRLIQLAGLVGMLAGCASGTEIFVAKNSCTGPLDSRSSRVEVERDKGGFGGSGAVIEIMDDDLVVARLGPGGKVCWDRKPGEVKLNCVTRSFMGDHPPYLCGQFRSSAGTKYTFVIKGPQQDLERVTKGE
jgi:hypothetical protein